MQHSTLYMFFYTLLWLSISLLMSYLSYKWGWLKRNKEKNDHIYKESKHYEELYNKAIKQIKCLRTIVGELKETRARFHQLILQQRGTIKLLENDNLSLLESIEVKNKALEEKIPEFYSPERANLQTEGMLVLIQEENLSRATV